jgi:hypothetical protein
LDDTTIALINTLISRINALEAALAIESTDSGNTNSFTAPGTIPAVNNN